MRISDWSSDVCSSDLFPADKVRIDVIGREHLIGLGREDELVRVVRHVQFLFADQLEIVALERTIEDERIVKRRRTGGTRIGRVRSEEHTSELQSLMRISYAVFCLKQKNNRILHYELYIIMTTTQSS